MKNLYKIFGAFPRTILVLFFFNKFRDSPPNGEPEALSPPHDEAQHVRVTPALGKDLKDLEMSLLAQVAEAYKRGARDKWEAALMVQPDVTWERIRMKRGT